MTPLQISVIDAPIWIITCSRQLRFTGTVFTTLYFLCNLRIRPISQSVTLHSGRKTSQFKTLLLGPFLRFEENEVL
jgi:hypothetical protein